ncbi:MAG: MBL fold metallo-hydrolase [Bacilli bacterium]|jgi:beta-lactamase superfamily II metal-dependent hydrolase|nr:MBL fold metallo-hydrolase [Bacilli bacterium]
MKRFVPFVLLLILSLTACNNQPIGSSNNDNSSPSIEQPAASYLERIQNMADIGITIDSDDQTIAETAAYDENAPLGSVAHPLSNSESDYLEILTFEQPTQYGDAYLIKVGDATIAIDFGNSSQQDYSDNSTYFDVMKDTYDAYLNNGHLDLLILTHPHADHYGGYPAMKEATKSIGMIVDYGYNYYYREQNYRRDVVDYYVNMGTEYHRIYDMVNEQDNGQKRTYVTSELFIDWLDTGYYSENFNDGAMVDDLNVTSLAGILAYRDFTYFFSGDLQNNPDGYGGTGGNGETSLVQINNANPEIFHEVTMMKAAHHGSSKGGNDVLLDVLEPKIVTISAGAPYATTYYNGKTGVCGGHPHLQTLTRYLTKGRKRTIPKVYLNFVNGTTSFVTDGINKVYMAGSPLRMSYEGSYLNNEIHRNHGSILDLYNDITTTEWGQVCHGL